MLITIIAFFKMIFSLTRILASKSNQVESYFATIKINIVVDWSHCSSVFGVGKLKLSLNPSNEDQFRCIWYQSHDGGGFSTKN